MPLHHLFRAKSGNAAENHLVCRLQICDGRERHPVDAAAAAVENSPDGFDGFGQEPPAPPPISVATLTELRRCAGTSRGFSVTDGRTDGRPAQLRPLVEIRGSESALDV